MIRDVLSIPFSKLSNRSQKYMNQNIWQKQPQNITFYETVPAHLPTASTLQPVPSTARTAYKCLILRILKLGILP